MAANDVVLRRAERSGVGILQPSLGLDALDAAMTHLMQPFTTCKLVAAVPFNWAVFIKVGGLLRAAYEWCMVSAGINASSMHHQVRCGRDNQAHRCNPCLLPGCRAYTGRSPRSSWSLRPCLWKRSPSNPSKGTGVWLRRPRVQGKLRRGTWTPMTATTREPWSQPCWRVFWRRQGESWAVMLRLRNH